MSEDFQPMTVAQILDKTTLVVTGPGVQKLPPGEELQIMAVGREIPTVGAPLVVPKATIEVTSNAGLYAIARTITYEEETTVPGWPSLTGTTSKTVTKRYVLSVNEKDLTGNPAASPVSVGDPVIRPIDLARFIASLVRKKD